MALRSLRQSLGHAEGHRGAPCPEELSVHWSTSVTELDSIPGDMPANLPEF